MHLFWSVSGGLCLPQPPLSLPFLSISVCLSLFLGDRLRQKSWSPSSVSCVAARKIVRRSCLGARPRYNLVVDEDVKKPNKQTNKLSFWMSLSLSMSLSHPLALARCRRITHYFPRQLQNRTH